MGQKGSKYPVFINHMICFSLACDKITEYHAGHANLGVVDIYRNHYWITNNPIYLFTKGIFVSTVSTTAKKYLHDTEQLNNYYEVNRTHLKWSFWASISAVCIGLIAILVGVWLILKGSTELTSSLATIGGVLTQFIGAGFFFLYTKNLKQLNVFYEKLIKLQDTEYAIELLELLPDNAKEKQVNTIITFLISRNEPKMEITTENLRALSEYNASQSS